MSKKETQKKKVEKKEDDLIDFEPEEEVKKVDKSSSQQYVSTN